MQSIQQYIRLPGIQFPDGAAIARSLSNGVLVALVAVIHPVLVAQTTNLAFKPVIIGDYSSQLYSAIQDDDGFIWFGKYNGIFRYNGQTLTRYVNDPSDPLSVTHGHTEYLFPGRNRDFWIGSASGGLSRFDIDTYQCTSWRHSLDDSNSLGGNAVGGILDQGDGVVWVGTDDFCLNRLDWQHDEVRRYYPADSNEDRRNSNYLGSIIQDMTDPDVLWVGAPFGVYRFRKSTGSFRLFRFDAYIQPYKPTPVPVYMDRQGKVWAAEGEGIVKLDPTDGSVQHIQLPKGANAHFVWMATDIRQYDADWFCIVTTHHGLIVHHSVTSEWFRVNDDINLGRDARFFFRDALGNAWLGSSAHVLRAVPDASGGRRFPLDHLPGNNWSRAFLPVSGRNALYVGTLKGAGLLYADFDDLSVTAFPYRIDPVAGTDVYYKDLAWSQDSTIYAATDSGLLHFDPGTGGFSRIFNPAGGRQWDDITSVCLCNNTIWFSTASGGLFGVRKDGSQHTTVAEVDLISPANDLHCANRQLWIGTNRSLSRLDKPHAEEPDCAVIIPDIHVNKIASSADGRIWVATFGHGVYVLDPESPQSFRQLYSSRGGEANMVYSLAIARNGTLWLNTDVGTLNFDPRTGEYFKNVETGLVQRSPVIELPNGSIVVGRNRMMMYFLPNEELGRGIPPRPYISKIDIANREKAFGKAVNRVDHITMYPGEREVVIEFDAINYNERPATTFRYRLSGLHEDWKNLGMQRYLALNNLEPGNYFLELKAVNEFGGESTKGKSLSIEVLPPMYQMWWFRIALSLLILVLAYRIYIYLRNRARRKTEIGKNERKLLEIQKEIAESKLTALQAQMNPHFIFNSLNSINWYILKNKPAEASIYLTKFSKLVRLILDNSKNLSIPLDKELEALRLYLDIESMRFDGTFGFEIQTDDEIDLEEVMIPPLILQPFVENAIWHGLMHRKGEGKLLIQIYPENDHLKCIVQDNGIGRRASRRMKVDGSESRYQSKGLKLTTDRVKLLHEDYLREDMIRIIDLVNDHGEAAGTRVEVVLPG